jgi:hypothetical protein
MFSFSGCECTRGDAGHSRHRVRAHPVTVPFVLVKTHRNLLAAVDALAASFARAVRRTPFTLVPNLPRCCRTILKDTFVWKSTIVRRKVPVNIPENIYNGDSY